MGKKTNPRLAEAQEATLETKRLSEYQKKTVFKSERKRRSSNRTGVRYLADQIEGHANFAIQGKAVINFIALERYLLEAQRRV